MDYKYIEQLLERYWNGETTLEEEQILHSFFAQEELPEHLLNYKSLFVYPKMQCETERLGEDFDEKVLRAIHAPVVKAEPLTALSRFSGLWKSAAAVAILCVLSGLGRQVFTPSGTAGYETLQAERDPQLATRKGFADTHVSMADSIRATQQTAIEKEPSVEKQ